MNWYETCVSAGGQIAGDFYGAISAEWQATQSLLPVGVMGKMERSPPALFVVLPPKAVAK